MMLHLNKDTARPNNKRKMRRSTRVSIILLSIIVIAAIIGPELSNWQPEDIDWDAMEQGPSLAHPFGTDLVGRDLFVRTMIGARTSLTIAVIATFVSLIIGVPWGAFAGYLGGRVDQFMMRIVDVLYGLPFILLVILLVVLFGRNPYLLFAALGAIFWLDLARIVRGQTLSIRQALFIEASRSLGAHTGQIVWRHIIPNVIGPVIVYATITLPSVILAESFISFLGLGVQEPNTSWGVLIADGTATIESSPWMLIFPGVLLVTTLWCCNTLGDRLSDHRDEIQRNPVNL
jgi:oligopeptide transport system permease protein|tara:strand:- start:727 stop:1593 length:867 start_codon:yes stop_codon:yes gene_type:complete